MAKQQMCYLMTSQCKFRNHFFSEKHVFLTEIIKTLRSKVTNKDKAIPA